MSPRPSTALITGGAGFVGTNVAERLLADGWHVRILDDLSRSGVSDNLERISSAHGAELEVIEADVREAEPLNRAISAADAVFHFAAQVAVTTSLDSPLEDADINIRGTLNVLEAARRQSTPPFLLFTSTNKVYGSLGDVTLQEGADRYEPADEEIRRNGVAEGRPLDFCTPYGCSKGAADQYVLDWSASYGVPTVVFRMSCIYGPHQCGTEDQGWVAHFLLRAREGRPITIYGDGKQVRDILYAEDLVEAMMLARDGSERLAGQAFNIGGGPGNAVSLRDVIGLIGNARGGQAPTIEHADWRQGDQRYFVTDHRRFSAATGWRPRVTPPEGIARLHDWFSRGSQRPAYTA